MLFKLNLKKNNKCFSITSHNFKVLFKTNAALEEDAISEDGKM